MEGLSAICCGCPTLVACAILYAKVPKLRWGLCVLGCLAGCLFTFFAGSAYDDEVRNGPVEAALDNQDPASLRRALDAGGSARADVGGDEPYPVLLKAIDYGDVASVEILLQRGADPNEKGNGKTPLAAASGNPKIARLLKRYGAR